MRLLLIVLFFTGTSLFAQTAKQKEYTKTPLKSGTKATEWDSLMRVKHTINWRLDTALKLVALGEHLMNDWGYYETTDIKGAIQNFKEAIAFDYTCSWVYYKLGLCYFRLQEYQDAIQTFSKCEMMFREEKVVPELDTDFYRPISYVYSADTFAVVYETSIWQSFYAVFGYRAESKIFLGDYYGGIKDLSTYLKDGEDARAYYYLGFCQYQLDKIDEAIISLKNSIRLEEREPAPHVTLGFCYRDKKQLKEACLQWSLAGEYGDTDIYETINEHCNK